jgi:hypothetical protein
MLCSRKGIAMAEAVANTNVLKLLKKMPVLNFQRIFSFKT